MCNSKYKDHNLSNINKNLEFDSLNNIQIKSIKYNYIEKDKNQIKSQNIRNKNSSITT